MNRRLKEYETEELLPDYIENQKYQIYSGK